MSFPLAWTRPCFAFLAAFAVGCSSPRVPLEALGNDASVPPHDAGDVVDAADASTEDAAIAMGSHQVLFVGNSYVDANDVPERYRALVGARFADVRIESVTAGGYTLAQHASDARSDGTPLAAFLRTGTPAETSFDAVILQEQSQIGGLRSSGFSSVERADSIAGASELALLAAQRGATVVLYLTWGRRLGDPQNELIGFGTFLGMADSLDEGYLGLASLLRERGVNARLAPVGGAFRLVYEDVTAAGLDPLAEGSDFSLLYQADGSHPSLRGAYLAACVLAGATTEGEVRTFPFEPTLGEVVSSKLLEVCARALEDPRWNVPGIVRPEATFRGSLSISEFFGSAVAISADGSRALVAGGEQMFVREDSWIADKTWPGALEVVEGALSADATRVLIGPGSELYLQEGGAWSLEATLPPGPGAFVGNSMRHAISEDGTRVIVGGNWDGGLGGPAVVAARIFVREASGWVQETELPASEPTFWSGVDVAIDATGERVVVADTMTRVYFRSLAGWTLETMLPSTGVVALSADGAHAIVGQRDVDRAVVFSRTSTTWTQVATLRGPRFSFFGQAVAISADGACALVGVPKDAPAATENVSGSARFFERVDGSYRWSRVLAPDGMVADHLGQFGHAVAMSSDGRSFVVGAPTVDVKGAMYVGEAYMFDLP